MRSRADLIVEKAFLGGEFLTWLWCASDRSDGRFKVQGEPVEVHFEDFLVLESLLADSQENTFKGGEPSRSAEARLALELGKKVSKAKLQVRKEDREWTFTIKADTLDVSSIKLPAVLSKLEDEQFYERLYLLEELDGIIDGLFIGFLKKRLSNAWEDEIATIKAWIAAGDEARDTPSGPPPVEMG